MRTTSRRAWPIVVTLAAVPCAALAQPVVCYPVQHGETASRLARRLTGNAANKYQPWFDIVDPSARSVPKSQYDRVRSGWRACVLEQRVRSRPTVPVPVVDAAAARPEAAATTPPTDTARTAPDVLRQSLIVLPPTLDANPARLWLGVAVIVPALGFLMLGGYVRRRNDARVFMTQFAYLFVRELERPLLQDGPDPALRAQVRVSPYRARLEICLAPGRGRRYPNLSDHRKNIEYDVDRVLAALADESFARGRLRMRNGWVVVPFRFNAHLKKRGVRCISSL